MFVPDKTYQRIPCDSSPMCRVISSCGLCCLCSDLNSKQNVLCGARCVFDRGAEESSVLPCAALFVSSHLTSFMILQRRARWFWVSSAGVIIMEQKSRARGFFFIVASHKDYSGNKVLAWKSGQCLFLNPSM